MKRAVLVALVLVSGMAASASAGGGTYKYGYPGHWGGWWNGGWETYYAERGHGRPCDWCVNPYGNYACDPFCGGCGCDTGCGCEMGEPAGQPGDMMPSEGPKPTTSTTMRRYESWPKATSLFPASTPR